MDERVSSLRANTELACGRVIISCYVFMYFTIVVTTRVSGFRAENYKSEIQSITITRHTVGVHVNDFVLQYTRCVDENARKRNGVRMGIPKPCAVFIF